ncbi:MAG: ZIP family metal transporter [Candidatus Buchananbacteria bacterium]
MVYLIILATVVFTFLGGLFALKFKDKLHLVLGFSAGALLGVAFFDLLPEAIELASGKFDVPVITAIIALGFVIYLFLDRLINIHCHDGNCANSKHRGRFGAASLSVHSFLDGMAIGLAFQVSASIGLIVAVAVLAHDFSDGINTVGLILKNNGKSKSAIFWLIIDAIAPALGIIATMFFTLPAEMLGVFLAVFCGFFLYIGASDLLPESHHSHPTFWTTFCTIIGMAVLYGVVRLAGI